jgi:hypothetical protein
MADFSVPLGTEPAYDGTMQATVFELAAPDTPVPTISAPRRTGA